MKFKNTNKASTYNVMYTHQYLCKVEGCCTSTPQITFIPHALHSKQKWCPNEHLQRQTVHSKADFTTNGVHWQAIVRRQEREILKMPIRNAHKPSQGPVGLTSLVQDKTTPNQHFVHYFLVSHIFGINRLKLNRLTCTENRTNGEPQMFCSIGSWELISVRQERYLSQHITTLFEEKMG